MYTVMILLFLLAALAAIAAAYLYRNGACARRDVVPAAVAPQVVKHKTLARIAQRPRNGPDTTSP